MSAPDEIRLHLLDTDSLSARDLAFGFDLLDGTEQARAERLAEGSARRAFIASRALCRQVLARETGLPAGALRFAYERGRLCLEAPPPAAGTRDTAFSVTRARGAVGVAVARGHPVGCDAERARSTLARRQTVDMICAAEEAAAWRALSEADRVPAFFDLWTAKESLLKMTGSGMGHAADVCCGFNPFRVTAFSSAPPDWTLWCGRWGDLHFALAAAAPAARVTARLHLAQGLAETALFGPDVEGAPLTISGGRKRWAQDGWTLDPALE